MACQTDTLTGLEALLQGISLELVLTETPADVLTKPVEIWRSHLTKSLSTLVDCEKAAIREAVLSTPETSLGDLAVILPRLKLKNINNHDLKALAFDIGARLPASALFLPPWVDGVSLRMFFAPNALSRLLLPYISDRKSTFGHYTSHGLGATTASGHEGKKVVVEFSSPNIAGDFDGNHLRSTLLGSFIANMYEAMGWEVVRLNYLGDWGKQIGLLAVGFERFGSEEALQLKNMSHLVDVYTRIKELFKPEQNARDKAKREKQSTADIEGKGIFAERDAFFKKMENGDKTALSLWRCFRDITIEDLAAGYGRLGVQFDEYSGESQVQPETIVQIEDILKDKGALEESDGSWVIDFVKQTGKKGLGTQIIRGRDGATRYLLRDIAAVLDREHKFKFDKMIYVVSSRQDNHFQRLFTSLELMGFSILRDKLQHVSFGPVQGLQTQLLGDILDQCAANMNDVLCKAQDSGDADGHPVGKVTDMSVVSALLAQDMSGRRAHGYSVDPQEMASFGPHTAWMLQEGHARLTASIVELRANDIQSSELDYSALEDDDSTDLLRIMAQFPDVVSAAYKSLEPHALLSYLYRLVDSLAPILEDKDANQEDRGGSATLLDTSSLGEKKAKLVLYESARQVLENGLKLLGFPLVL